MKLSQLIAKIGDENVKFQILQNALSGISLGKEGDSKVTFFTDAITPSDVMQNKGKVGLVVWIPREHWEKVAKDV
jgi:hypothetical protein